mmetsp:Transcript_10510/g.33399  ORF Transcript_10510/g.33399 Transcript_10510/m.33399 type:complete len:201 (+) Transcript_10510:290-892(+)
MTTSGCANSEERDGTSLDTKGMASFQRVRGMNGSTSIARFLSSSFIRPNVTRSILRSACGKKEASQSAHMLSCLKYLPIAPPTSDSELDCRRSSGGCASAPAPAPAGRVTEWVAAVWMGSTTTLMRTPRGAHQRTGRLTHQPRLGQSRTGWAREAREARAVPRVAAAAAAATHLLLPPARRAPRTSGNRRHTRRTTSSTR